MAPVPLPACPGQRLGSAKGHRSRRAGLPGDQTLPSGSAEPGREEAAGLPPPAQVSCLHRHCGHRCPAGLGGEEDPESQVGGHRILMRHRILLPRGYTPLRHSPFNDYTAL